ncbi:TonB-dependent siderophore receptor [Pseudochelatococcus sp. B33]
MGDVISDNGKRISYRRSVKAMLLGTAAIYLAAGLTGDLVQIAHAQNSAAQSAVTDATTFNIRPQELGSALTAFADRAGLRLLFPSKLVAGKRSPGISGTLTQEQALNRLLAGTGLSWRFTVANTVTIIDPSASNGASNVETDGSLVLDTITVQGQGENAWGPVDGYVATRSAIGTKTGASIVETPQSLSVIGRQEMEDRGVKTLGEALVYTPGVNTSTDGQVDNGMEAIRIRGFSADSPYVDGIYNPEGWIEPYGMERIEVLRGPASILYGQASPGGVIGAVSRMPTEHTVREVGVLTSEHGGIQGTFDFGGKLTDDGTLLYRLTGLGRDLGAGFNAKDVRLKRIYIAPALTWKPTEDTKLTVLAKYQYDPDFPGQMATWPRVGTLVPSTSGFRFRNNMYLSDPAFDDHSYREQSQVGYLLEHNLTKNWTIKQNLRIIRNELERMYLLGFPNANNPVTFRNAQRQYGLQDTYAVDNQLLGRFNTWSLKHSSIIGFDFRRIDTTGMNAAAGTAPTIDLSNPIYGIVSGPIPALTSGTNQRLYQTGVYAQDQIKWGGFTLLAGGRYDWASSRTWNIFDNHKLTNETKQEKFTYRVGAVYEFANGIAPYISYTTSFQPQTGTTGPERGNSPFEPTTGQQAEIGIKYQPPWFDGFFTVAVYDLKRQNVVTVDPIYTTRQIQLGEVQSKGFEFSASGNITDEFRFIAQYSYTDSRTTKGYTRPGGVDPVGKTGTGIPLHTAGFWLDYTFSSGPLDGLGLAAGVRYSGASWGDTENTWKVPGATVVDAAIRYDLGKRFPNLDGLNAAVNITNLLDKEYINRCITVSGSCTFGAGRRITGSIVYRW